jgi:hypothetical protein
MAARMSENQKIQGRLDAAKINGGAHAVTSRGNDRYTVEGRTGNRYTVFAPSLETILCDCKAGLLGHTPCWHAAATFLFIVSESTVAA